MPPSVEPSTSAIESRGRCWMRRCFTSSENIAPDETSVCRHDASQRPECSSSARSIGRANASPTITSRFTRSRDTVSHSSIGSRPRCASSAAVPPSMCGTIMPSQQPVPCMSGGPDIATVARPAACAERARSGRSSALRSFAMPTICG